MSTPSQTRVLVAEDDGSLRLVMTTLLTDAGYLVEAVASAPEAMRVLEQEDIDIVVADIGLPGGSGLHILGAVAQRLPVIVITARTTLDNAIAAMRGGAFEYLPKPFDLDDLEAAVARAATESARSDERQPTLEDGRAERSEILVGHSPAMQRVFTSIGRAALRDAPVLIEGESGTGKELVARVIHRHSARAEGPFIAVNVAALPEALAESELFGHERGAYTGADTARVGLVRAAHGGTLFLDEIGEMATSVQAKLLRVLEEGVVTPIGSTSEVPVSVRIVSATHRDLQREVAEGRFRADLYYRLYVLPIVLPPLRERYEDIPELARHLLERIARDRDESSRSLTSQAVKVLQRRDWPGNVRELYNVLMRAVAFSEASTLDAVHLEPTTSHGATDHGPWADVELHLGRVLEQTKIGTWYSGVLEPLERRILVEALKAEGGNQVATARRLGIHRNTLRARLQALAIDATEFRGESDQ